jgi:hypothetical protein
MGPFGRAAVAEHASISAIAPAAKVFEQFTVVTCLKNFSVQESFSTQGVKSGCTSA